MAHVIPAEFTDERPDCRTAVLHAMQAAWRALDPPVTAEEWARRLGVTPAAVAAYLSGANVPPGDVLLEAMNQAGWPAAQHLEKWASGFGNLALARRAFEPAPARQSSR